MTKFDDLIMKENIKIYEEVIHKICELFIKLKIHKDPVKIYETFIQMFENGILSNHGIYKDMIPNKCINIEVNGLIAMDICGIILFTGFGICRHTTDFLRHIYQHLGYDSSQLFTYHPSLQIHGHNFGKKILTNEEFQKYIDEAIADLDLFSNKEHHFTKKFGDILIIVDYLPETYSLINHTYCLRPNKKSSHSRYKISLYWRKNGQQKYKIKL